MTEKIRSLAALAALVLLGWLLVEAALTVRDVRATSAGLRATLLEGEGSAAANLQRASLLARNATNTANEALKEQREYAKISHEEAIKTTRQANATLAAAGKLIRNTDESLNARLVPQMVKTLAGTDAQMALLVEGSGVAMRRMTEDLHGALGEAATAMKQAGAVAADPNIPRTLAETAATMEELHGAMEKGNAAMANVEKSTAHIEKALRPGKIVWRALNWVWDKAVALVTAGRR